MKPPPTTIDHIWAREIIDSRATPTVEVEITLASGAVGRAVAPSGASTGAYEAHELRDGGERYGGKGVQQAVAAVRDRIGPEIVGRDALDQRGLDDALRMMDGTPNLADLGANAVLGVSLAAARATANHLGIGLHRYLGGPGGGVLPVPLFNVLNGGAHADNGVDVQEFMFVPGGVASYPEALRAGAECYAVLRRIAGERKLSTNVGDEGGIAPELDSTRAALDLLCDAIEAAGYRVPDEVAVGLDVAATELVTPDGYHLEGRTLGAPELAEVYAGLVDDYPIVSIEDPLGEEDWDGWQELTSRLGDRVQIVGDDLLVTNPDRLRRGIEQRCANAVLVKPNQIGTLSATLETIDVSRRAGWAAMMSHRSGDTEDVTIAHLAVGCATGQIKAGAPARGERTAKYNELLRIAEDLGAGARFAGWGAFATGTPDR